MGCVGNAIWFLLGGCVMGLSWLAVGILWCVTVVGVPVGVQCFKFAELAFFPFGKEIRYGGGAGSLLLNLLWLVFGGFALAVEAAAVGALFCMTVVGIPFGMQCFKIAKLALMPFGSAVN
ncbi:YccF domain-containing protein [Caproicibacter fermentans]|uniref:YccF domain-containing protein n=1 Tax=Caproicibacter fermentans TaxID=2576756 RepID=A0A7G8T9J7_9FIRM|nr:YccF domain-containing protein [Caproicibacter fermentans]QNK40288.1 YccF domain-containing protein [Caproicibacter fermentans]